MDGDLDQLVGVGQPALARRAVELAGDGVAPPLVAQAAVAVGHAGHAVVGQAGQARPAERHEAAVALDAAVLLLQAAADFGAAVGVAVGRFGEGLGVDGDGPLEAGAVVGKRLDAPAHPRYWMRAPTRSLFSRLFRCSPSRMNSTAAASSPGDSAPVARSASASPSMFSARRW